MKKLIIILVLFSSCNTESVEPLTDINGFWKDHESVNIFISPDYVTINTHFRGYIVAQTDRSFTIVGEYKDVNWFYEVSLLDSVDKWYQYDLDGYVMARRWKTVDSDSLTIRQDWEIPIIKID